MLTMYTTPVLYLCMDLLRLWATGTERSTHIPGTIGPSLEVSHA